MTVATGNFPELLWPGIKSLFGDTYKEYPTVYTQCFIVTSSSLAFEKVQGVTRLGLAGVKEQGNTATFVDPTQGHQKEYVHINYGLGSSITREMNSDDQYGYIRGIPQWLARSMRQTEETVHSNVFNNSFTSQLAADGLSVFNSAHLNVATNTSQFNTPAVASDLTQTSLEQAYIDIADWTDDQDIKMQVKVQKLLVPNETRFVMQKILMTSGEVGSADNTINPMYEVVKGVVWEYLTDPDAWFLLTDVEGFRSFTRWGTQLDRDNEFETQNLRFLSTRRWSEGVDDWRAGYGSPGA